MMLTQAEFIEKQKQRWAETPWVKSKDMKRNGVHWWRRESFTLLPHSTSPNVVLVMERLAWDRFEATAAEERPTREHVHGEQEYRIGYFTVSRRGTWWWGQFAPFIPAADLDRLLEQARADGTILATVPGTWPD